MTKTNVPGMVVKKDKNGNRLSKKAVSHGTFRAKRKPNSKWVKNGTVK